MLISLAVDYQAADVATRERFHVPVTHVAPLYARLNDDGIAEMVLVATCNRTELYAWCPEARASALPVLHKKLARRWMPKAADADALLKIAMRRSDGSASRHAIRVAVGLESQVLGDGQILGQVRRAYAEASAERATGPVLHRLFESALRAGKRVQANTQLGSGKNSVGAQAAALCVRRFGQLTHTRIVILGCGKTGERVARQLSKFGARDLVFINRTEGRAAELAAELKGRSASLETAHTEIAMADIAIVATGSEVPIIIAESLAQARSNCATNCYPLLLVDLSMPRNVSVTAAALEGVTLVDLDALQPQVAATEQQRRTAVPAAEAIVETELHEFSEWLAASTAREAIRPLREALADVCRKELAHATGDEVAERLVKRIVAKMMARPMSAVRVAMARGEPVTELTRTMTTLFAIPAYETTHVPAHAGGSIE
ncbi:MAG: glutamyl-tRNA reductase [Phycisphaerae bacterium]|nr:glutamyl-tRNA reductase [Gemmatimonadaceae bacterium]